MEDLEMQSLLEILVGRPGAEKIKKTGSLASELVLHLGIPLSF